ncbi:MAG: peptidylprolyl isomerase [Planctomycetota bacterium]|jgi:parvulin-like peptidyl-prolyl isomerase
MSARAPIALILGGLILGGLILGGLFAGSAAAQDRASANETSRIVAEVNGVPITYRDLLVSLSMDPAWVTALESNPASAADQRPAFERRLLNNLINDMVMSQEAKSRGIRLSPEQEREIQQNYEDEMIRRWLLPRNATPEQRAAVENLPRNEKLKAASENQTNYFEQRGIPADRPFERYRQRDLIRTLFQQEVQKIDIFIRPEDIKAYYDRNRSEYSQPGKIVFRQILILARDSEKKAEALSRECHAAISAGASFNEVSGEHSDGPKAEEGGVTTWTSLEDGIEGLRNVVKTLKPGDVSAPTLITIGGSSSGRRKKPGKKAYVIIALDEWQEEGTLLLDTVEPRIRRHLSKLREDEIIADLTQQLRNQATIRIRLSN